MLARAVVAAARSARLNRRVGCHTLRHNADCRIMPTRLAG
jgi:hypothetical protein